MNKTILILGGGIMQIPAIRQAKSKGWRVIVADANPTAPGVEMADRFEKVDLTDRDGMVRTAKRYSEGGGLDGVFTAGTDFSTTVAAVAEACGLSGVPYEVALSATDKNRMRNAFKEAGVPCPDFVGLGEKDDPVRALGRIAFPVVVKPVDNMGARGVQRVDSEDALRQAFDRAIGASRVRRVILESYMEGPELSVDAIVHRGEITVCGIADRHICFPPYFVEMGHTMPSNLGSEILDEATQVFMRGVAALGIENGAAKGDVKITQHGPMIGEIAARLSGGYMSGWTFPYASGVEVTDAALNIAVGSAPGDLAPRHKNVSAERALISIPGTVREVVGRHEACRVEGIRDVFLLVRENDDVVFPRNNVQKCSNVISVAPTRSKAVAAAEKAIGCLFVRLVPNTLSTDQFLSAVDDSSSLSSPHLESVCAFRLQDRRNCQALRSMPLQKEGNGDLVLLALPDLDKEHCRDWHGMKIQDAMNRVVSITKVPVVRSAREENFALGRTFWNAFLKGGAQGGVYAIDTIRATRSARREISNAVSILS